MTVRRLRSTATYEDGETFSREFELEISDDDTTTEQLEELLQPETGFGHFAEDGSSLDAYYEIKSIDGLEPEISEEWQG